jgi:hypothetical protein
LRHAGRCSSLHTAATKQSSIDPGKYWNLLELAGPAKVGPVSEAAEGLERQIAQLRAAVREAVLAGDRDRARALRAELKVAENAWDDALDEAAEHAPRPPEKPEKPEKQEKEHRTGPLLPLREQVHQALSLLTVPAAPRLIATVHEAFFAATFPTARLTSLKRDEERSFRTAPYARPYYICAALTADRLAPSRGLLAVSTWPMERRVIGSLSPRVDYLISAIRIAEAVNRLPAETQTATRLLWRFAANIPGLQTPAATLDSRAVIQAAEAELAVHESADSQTRTTAAQRARDQLDDVQQLFGARLEIQRLEIQRLEMHRRSS